MLFIAVFEQNPSFDAHALSSRNSQTYIQLITGADWLFKSTATQYSTARQSAASRSCSMCRAIVLQAPRRSHAKPLMRQLHWLPIQHSIDYKVSVLTYKTLNTSVPRYLSQRSNRCVNARTLRSTATPLLIQPFARTDVAKRSFRCDEPSVWNSLPESVIGSDSLSVFKSRLKHAYFVSPITIARTTDCRQRLRSYDLMTLYEYAYYYHR